MTIRCNRCNRVLRNPVCVEMGYGSVCAKKAGIKKRNKPKAFRQVDYTEESVGREPEWEGAQTNFLDIYYAKEAANA